MCGEGGGRYPYASVLEVKLEKDSDSSPCFYVYGILESVAYVSTFLYRESDVKNDATLMSVR